MSTRSQLQFGYDDNGTFERTAMLYNHWDGYPESRLLDIQHAIKKAHESYGKSAGMSYRVATTYPSDLAAFYVLANKDGAGNIEIDEHLHGDIEYLYQIWQDDEGVFHVKILTTHQPEGEDYDPEKFKDFWDEPKVEKMRVQDEGTLDELIEKYCKEEQ